MDAAHLTRLMGAKNLKRGSFTRRIQMNKEDDHVLPTVSSNTFVGLSLLGLCLSLLSDFAAYEVPKVPCYSPAFLSTQATIYRCRKLTFPFGLAPQYSNAFTTAQPPFSSSIWAL